MLPFFDCPEVFSLDQSVLIEFRLRLFLFPRRIGRVFIIDGGDEEEWTALDAEPKDSTFRRWFESKERRPNLIY